MFSKDYKSLA